MISVADAAARLGVSEERVRALCRARRIKGARYIGRIWLIPAELEVTPGRRGPQLGTRRES